MNSSKSMGAVSPVAPSCSANWVVTAVTWTACLFSFTGCANSNAHVDAPREVMRRNACAQLEKSLLELIQKMQASHQFSETYGKVKSAKDKRPVIGVEIYGAPNESVYVLLMDVMRYALFDLWDFSSRFETVQAEYAKYRFRRYHPYPYDRITQLDHKLDELRRKELDFLLMVKLENSTDMNDSSSSVLFIHLYDSKKGKVVWMGELKACQLQVF